MPKTPLLALLALALFAFKTPKEFKKLKHYAFVPLGQMTYHIKDGDKWLVKKDTLPSFLISKTEVSNLEYTEFLYALRSKSEQEYVKNRPDSTVWAHKLTYGGPFMTYYGNHPAYHDYPVVGVAKAQAEAYCSWLTEQLRKNYPDIHVKARLPKKHEWMRAARGAKTTMYPNGDYLRNDKGLHMYNFLQIGDENITLNRDSALYQVVNYHNLNEDEGFITTTCMSYWPNEFGLYNTSGNVAEMIADEDVAMGGGWNSPGYDIRVESEMPNAPSAQVGFRVLLEIR